MKLFFPDACWSGDLISGALFLYFHKEKIGLTLHPSVSTFMTGIDPFDFARFVEERQPKWTPNFRQFMLHWRYYNTKNMETGVLLEPLREVATKSIWLTYPRGSSAWDAAHDLLRSSSLEPHEIENLIDPYSAADELFSHVFFEKYLELYEGHRTPAELGGLAAETARHPERRNKSVDWTRLFEYCDKLFNSMRLEALFAHAYMFRLPVLQATDAVLLSNPGLLSFLASLPVQAPRRKAEANIDLDVIAWEFFRQIVSPHVDPLTEDVVEKIVHIIAKRPTEIDALTRKCLDLAISLGEESDLPELQRSIANRIRASVEGEVQALLSLDKHAARQLLDAVFADEKAWAAIAGFLYSLLHGGPLLTAGAAILTLGNLGAHAVKEASARRERIVTSDYALLYRMKN